MKWAKKFIRCYQQAAHKALLSADANAYVIRCAWLPSALWLALRDI